MNVFVVVLFWLHVTLASISEEKCEEWSKFNREKRETNEFLSAFLNIPPPGKVPTTVDEFPHMVRLGYGDYNDNNTVWACAGTLINNEYVLTSASCETLEVLRLHHRRRRKRYFIQELNVNQSIPDINVDTRVKWVKLGVNEIIQIEKIIIHPEFKLPSIYNDIALLKLSKKVNFTESIRPACLYSKYDDLTNQTLVATGWGAQKFGLYFSKKLMKTDLEIYTDEKCTEEYQQIRKNILENGVIQTQFCAGGKDERRDLCSGDGGDPLQMVNRKYPNMFDIVGVVSFGYTCNLLNIPVMATKVTAFLPWIEKIVWDI